MADVVGDGDAHVADASDLAGIAADPRVARRLDRGRELQVGIALQARDDARPHPARGAGHDDVDHAMTTSRGRRS